MAAHLCDFRFFCRRFRRGRGMKFSRGIHRGGQRLRYRRQGLLSRGGPRCRLIGRRWSAGGWARLIGRRWSAGGCVCLIGRRGFVAASCRLIGRLSSGRRGHVVLRLFAVVGCCLAWRLFIGRSCGGGVLFGAWRAEGGHGGQRHGAGGRNGGPRKACKKMWKDIGYVRSI
jgi:hypothetical protein